MARKLGKTFQIFLICSKDVFIIIFIKYYIQFFKVY